MPENIHSQDEMSPFTPINCSDPEAVNCCPKVQNMETCSDCIGCDCITIWGPSDGEWLGFDFCPETQCTGDNSTCIYEVVCANPRAKNYDKRCDLYPRGANQCISKDNGNHCIY